VRFGLVDRLQEVGEQPLHADRPSPDEGFATTPAKPVNAAVRRGRTA
jgi:hypothetical protein